MAGNFLADAGLGIISCLLLALMLWWARPRSAQASEAAWQQATRKRPSGLNGDAPLMQA